MSPPIGKLTRRGALGYALLGMCTIPVVVEAATPAAAGKLPLLSPADPAAKPLGYIEDANKVDAKANPMYKKGQICANCFQWDEKTAVANGKCKLFPGKVVKAAGWCKVYVKKP